MGTNRLSREEAEEKIRDYQSWEICDEIYNHHCKNDPDFISKINFYEWRETPEAKQEIKECIEQQIADADEMLQRSVLVEVEYSDHTDWNLEQRVLPKHPCTIAQFSHH